MSPIRVFIDSSDSQFVQALTGVLHQAGVVVAHSGNGVNITLTDKDKSLACAPAEIFLKKPVRLATLLPQLKSAGAVRQEIMISPRYLLDFHHKSLHDAHRRQSLSLTDKELAIMTALADGTPVARDALLAEAFGYGSDLETHTLETHVWRLRQKLKEWLDDALEIATTENGYRLEVK